jgi:ribosomal protein S18 acetylase RimI-like enzyme
MYDIIEVNNREQLSTYIDLESLVSFINTEMAPFEDSVSAIRKAIDYSLSQETGRGGAILLWLIDTRVVGVVVLNYSGMDEYIPNLFLVYIVVRNDCRGKGIGKNMLKWVISHYSESIALHVEYDNPAKLLYEKLGFTTKYAEMRYVRR